MSIFKRKSRIDNESMTHGVHLIVDSHPKSPVSEQFRTVRTNIQFMAVDREIKTLAFTSSAISEGKSTVSVNTAVAWAQQGDQVLFIDADLRRPTAHQTFGLDNRTGLTTILSSRDQQMNLANVIRPSGIANLTVIPSGPIPPNPSELLNSSRMRTLIEAAKNSFDIVIVDAPPMLQVTDAQILAGQVDGVVLVVRQGVAQKAALRRCVQLAKIAKANLLGFVLNDVRSEDGGYGYGYGYGETEKSSDGK